MRDRDAPAPQSDGSDARLTVLHLVDCLNPGGTESQLVGTLAFTDRRRVRPLVATFHEGGILLPRLAALGVPVAAFPLRVRLAHPNTVLQVARLWRFCLRERVRVIHAHDFYANLVGVVVARLAGARIVASRRDLAHWLSPLQRRALGYACRASDAVVVNARAVAAMSDDGLGLARAPVWLVENGIDLERFDRESALPPSPPIAWLDDGERARTVIVVSNLNLPDKGHADLLHAMALLDGRGVRMRLLVVGEGAERARLVALAERLRLGERVCFAGRRLDVPRLFSRVGAACLPSWAEGFPNAVMEAMAAALPAVATAVGGCPELIDDGVTGHLVPPRSPAALADALGRVLSDPVAAAAMGRHAREVVAARYAQRDAAALLEDLYLEIDGGGRDAALHPDLADSTAP